MAEDATTTSIRRQGRTGLRKIHAPSLGRNLPPGTRLREDEMRRIFGVSRARIRKVFSRLAYAGAGHDRAQQGRVGVPADARRGEGNLCGKTRHRRHDRTAARRQARTSRHRDPDPPYRAGGRCRDPRANWNEMVRLSGEFHLLLAEIAGNAILLRFLRELITAGGCCVILVYERPGKLELFAPRAPADPRRADGRGSCTCGGTDGRAPRQCRGSSRPRSGHAKVRGSRPAVRDRVGAFALEQLRQSSVDNFQCSIIASSAPRARGRPRSCSSMTCSRFANPSFVPSGF